MTDGKLKRKPLYKMGTRVAATIAEREATKTGKNSVVAASREPTTLYVFALDHPDVPRAAMTVLWELSPAGQVVRPSEKTATGLAFRA